MTTENKPRHLNAIDFMMMDVHRELDEYEENLHPETFVDKSARPQQEEHSEDQGVGVSHARCEFCFEPLPCPHHPNVEPLDTVTRLDLNPLHIIAQAHGAGLKQVVIVGELEDGSEYFGSSVADGADAAWHLQRGIYNLNKIIDSRGEKREDGKGPA